MLDVISDVFTYDPENVFPYTLFHLLDKLPKSYVISELGPTVPLTSNSNNVGIVPIPTLLPLIVITIVLFALMSNL